MITALQTNFPSKVKTVSSSWRIQEQDVKASFKELEIKSSGNFCVVDSSLYKGWLNGSIKGIADLDCDGVSVIDDNGQDYLILVELKSSCSRNQVYKAYKQLYYTALKMHSILALCPAYSPLILRAIGVIVCPDDGKLLSDKQKFGMLNGNFPKDVEFVLKLYDRRTLYLTLGQVPFSQGLALPNDLKAMDLKIHLQLADKPTDKSKTINLAPLL